MNTSTQNATERPVIDEVFQWMVLREPEVWNRLATQRAHELIHVRAVVCTAEPGGIDLDLGRGITANECVIPILEGPRAFFVSLVASLQARLSGGRSEVMLGHSLSFDSNFADDLHAFVNGGKLGEAERNRVLSVLMLRANNRHVQFDIVPFLFENIRLTREDERNERPVDTLVTFRMLDSLNWETFRKQPGVCDFGTDAADLRQSLRPAAVETVAEFSKSKDVTRFEARSLGTQALLLRFATLWHTSKKNRQHILGELVDFCILELGFFPATELSMIWCGIAGKQAAPFLGPITGRAGEMLSKIRAMAWDLNHARLLESISSQRERGSFYIPHFVSVDMRWRELLRVNPVRNMLFDVCRGSMLVVRAREAEFQRAYRAAHSQADSSEFSTDRITARRTAASSIEKEDMQRLVDAEQKRCVEALS